MSGEPETTPSDPFAALLAEAIREFRETATKAGLSDAEQEMILAKLRGERVGNG